MAWRKHKLVVPLMSTWLLNLAWRICFEYEGALQRYLLKINVTKIVKFSVRRKNDIFLISSTQLKSLQMPALSLVVWSCNFAAKARAWKWFLLLWQNVKCQKHPFANILPLDTFKQYFSYLLALTESKRWNCWNTFFAISRFAIIKETTSGYRAIGWASNF